jgi:hypothetical protein
MAVAFALTGVRAVRDPSVQMARADVGSTAVPASAAHAYPRG